MTEAQAMLGVWMGIPPEHENDLNNWYNEEHLAERLSMPGFLEARRYVSLEGAPKYFAMYDLEDLGALRTPEYTFALRESTPWTRSVVGKLTANVRHEYELMQAVGASPEGGAPYALIVQLETDEANDAELNEWYSKEHLAALAGVPGVFGARRYRNTTGSPRYLMIYEAASRQIIRNRAWKEAATTEWTLRMRPHFRNRRDNIVQLIVSRKATPTLS